MQQEGRIIPTGLVNIAVGYIRRMEEPDPEELRKRIRRRLKQLGRGPIEAARIGAKGVGKGAIGREYLSDFLLGKKASINGAKLTQVAKGLDWSVAQLLGQPSVKKGGPSVTEGGEHEAGVADWVSVPEHDVRAGLSYGGGISQEEVTIDEHGNTVATDSVRQRWGVPTPFLRDELGIRPGRVHILPVRGDSMTDALFDGDRVMLDLDDTDVSQGGIFALRDDNGSVIVKQVELLRGTKGQAPRIRCKSRNPHYEAFELSLESPVQILGRVACRITRL